MRVLWERRDRRPSDSLLWRGLVTLVLLRVTFVWFQLACWRSLDFGKLVTPVFLKGTFVWLQPSPKLRFVVSQVQES
jgi:hypothetical protein